MIDVDMQFYIYIYTYPHHSKIRIQDKINVRSFGMILFKCGSLSSSGILVAYNDSPTTYKRHSNKFILEFILKYIQRHPHSTHILKYAPTHMNKTQWRCRYTSHIWKSQTANYHRRQAYSHPPLFLITKQKHMERSNLEHWFPTPLLVLQTTPNQPCHSLSPRPHQTGQ